MRGEENLVTRKGSGIVVLTLCLVLGALIFGPLTATAESVDETGADQEASEGESQEDEESEPEEEAETRDRPARQMGGPGQVDNQIAEDEFSISRLVEKALLDPYFGWKKNLQEKRGLSFGIDYSGVYLAANDSPAKDEAGSGIARFFGSWDLVGRESGNTGAFVWKIEHRHRYTTIPPSAFGFNLGYIGLIEPPFSDQDLRWTNLYWRQRWREGKTAMFAGFLDATDYLDVYLLANPWTGFMNFAFSTGTLTIPVPNDATLGAAVGAMVSKNLFLIGGLVDRNGDPEHPFDGFDTFFNDNEYFSSLEIGWTPGHEQIYLDNVHLTLWHADQRVLVGEPSGWGANFSFTRYLKKKWYPFVRAGYADEGGSLMEKSVSAGFGYQPVQGSDLFGVGLNWGEPNEHTWEPGIRDQYTAEVFFRWQVAAQFALTPDIQYLENPALNPAKSSIWVWGLRARLAL